MSDALNDGFAGKVAFVAGGYGGIGEAVAQRARATRRDRGGRRAATRPRREALAASLVATGGGASSVAFDARDVASIRDAVDEPRDAPRRHRLPRQLRRHAADRAADRGHRGGVRPRRSTSISRPRCSSRRRWRGCRSPPGRGGRHVHLLSVRAQLGMRDRGYSAYCSSKGGLALLVKQHAVELARHGINVNGVAPTVVRTRMASDWLPIRRSTAA